MYTYMYIHICNYIWIIYIYIYVWLMYTVLVFFVLIYTTVCIRYDLSIFFEFRFLHFRMGAAQVSELWPCQTFGMISCGQPLEDIQKWMKKSQLFKIWPSHVFWFFSPYTPPLKSGTGVCPEMRGIVSPSPGGWWHGFKTTTQLGFSATHSENYQMGYLTFRQSRIFLVWFKVLACIGYRSHCIPIKSH
jgi:hypothetical protein